MFVKCVNATRSHRKLNYQNEIFENKELYNHSFRVSSNN